MPKTLRFVPWFCGLPCDPMILEVRRDRLVVRQGGCPACREEVAEFSDRDAAARAGGKDATTDAAIDAATQILRAAKAPFVHGLSRSANGTARRAAAVAALLRGAIDVEDADVIHADLASLSTFGLPSATFGEIRNRADLVLLWRCDPRRTHSFLFERPARVPSSPPRAIVLVRPADASDPGADLTLGVRDGGDLESALALRALVNQTTLDVESAGGVSRDHLAAAAGLLRRARYSAIVWDRAVSAAPGGFAIVSSLTLLARDLNRTTRSVARPLGAGGNVAGAIASIAAATTFPRAVGFASGAPRYAPGELDAARLIGEGRADALLLVGPRSSPGRPYKDEAVGRRRRSTPGRGRAGPGIVVVGPRLPHGAGEPDVFIPTATPGLSAAGAVTRADGTTVVLKALLPSRLPTEDEVLDRLVQRLRASDGSAASRTG